VSIPNAQFINEGVKNYYGRKKFMYKWDLDVPYETSSERVEKLISALKELITRLPEVNQDMCWIYLERLDRYSKVVRVWFQVGLPDWATSLFYGSRVLKKIQEVFASQGVDFAFPTSSVHLQGLGDSPELRALIPDLADPQAGSSKNSG
jgi:MscS family membrane protein